MTSSERTYSDASALAGSIRSHLLVCESENLEKIMSTKLALEAIRKASREQCGLSNFDIIKSKYADRLPLSYDVAIFEDILCHLHLQLQEIRASKYHPALKARTAVYLTQASVLVTNILLNMLQFHEEFVPQTVIYDLSKEKKPARFRQSFITKKLSLLLSPFLTEASMLQQTELYDHLKYRPVITGVHHPVLCLKFLKKEFEELSANFANISNDFYTQDIEQDLFQINPETDFEFFYIAQEEMRQTIKLLSFCIKQANSLIDALTLVQYRETSIREVLSLMDKERSNFIYPYVLPCIFFIEKRLVKGGILQPQVYIEDKVHVFRNQVTKANFLRLFELYLLMKQAYH